MSTSCPSLLPLAMLGLTFATCATAPQRVQATTEAEAVEEVIAVLGATLPCPKYAAAWLANRPLEIEHRCTSTALDAEDLNEHVRGRGVSYVIDMALARERYTSGYRARGTPTPPVVLAQFLSNLANLATWDSANHPPSPLMVYSKSGVLPVTSPSNTIHDRQSTMQAIMIFTR
jgi:hypothetical protein